ncbi:hypothetical protein JNO04_11265 [Halomonas sp. MC140]|nr:hypothetical protein [Halomonas sp. MC140]MDN7132925.1 hypothetical protein [Halomonas sp. MC140]
MSPGWEQIAHFRFEAIVEKKHEFRKKGYFQWLEEDNELGCAVQPTSRLQAGVSPESQPSAPVP